MYCVFMANKTVPPNNKRVCTSFTLPKYLKPQLQNAAIEMDISMSVFVENAIVEKMNREGFTVRVIIKQKR